METRKAAITAAPNTNRGKDSKNICIGSSIKELFRTGKKLTAKKINQLTNSNDARKQISVLRRSGWNICDIRRPDGSKLYWLAEDDRQGVLNFQGECL